MQRKHCSIIRSAVYKVMEKGQSTDISISIASYNTLALTRQTLQSLYNYDSKCSFEVFVIDNGSQDGTQDMIRQEFPQVNLIANTENVGVARATNQAIERSTGRYFLTMNSDVVVRPGALDALIEFMDSHPDVGAASARLVRPDGGEHPTVAGPVPTPWAEMLLAMSPLGKWVERIAVRRYFGPPRDWTKTQEVPCIYWGTALVVRREVIDQIGGQDTRFFIYGEDLDWTMRIAKSGWKLYYIADAEIVHYGGQSTKQASSKMLALLHKSKARVIQKHYGFAAGVLLRATYAKVWGLRLLRWCMIYLISPKKRAQSAERIYGMWQVIRGVLTY